jgi:hypothetical protein
MDFDDCTLDQGDWDALFVPRVELNLLIPEAASYTPEDQSSTVQQLWQEP